MGLRESLQRNPAVSAVVALVLLGGAIALLATRGGSSPSKPLGSRAWYYDLGSGKLFPADNQFPPIATPSGGEGVRAMIFSCGVCDEKTWTLAYLETHTPQAKAAMQKPADTLEQTQARTAAMTAGRLVAIPPIAGEKAVWTPSNAPGANAILARASIKCPDPNTQPHLCSP